MRRMNRKQRLITYILGTLPAVLGACAEEQPVLTIGAGGSLGNYYATGRAIARVVNDTQGTHGYLVEEQETTGSVENIDAVISGEAAFGIAQADRAYQAVNGVAEWADRGPQEELRAVFSLYDEAITVVATPDSAIRTTQDLIGKRVDIGHPDSGIRQNAIDTLDAAGIDWRSDIVAYEETPDERAAMYLRGELDAFFQTVGHPTTDIVFAVNSVPRARLVSLTNVEQLLSERPYYAPFRIPVDLYPGIENQSDVDTVGVRTVLLTSAQVPSEAVRAVTKAVLDNLEALGEYDPILTTFEKEDMLEGISAPLHPGAVSYFEEVGLLPSS